MKFKSRTQRYYDENPEARRKKNNYQKTFNKKPSQIKKRVELNAYNRKTKDPKGNRTDASHINGRIVGHISQSKNRGSKSNSAGDRRARGGRRR